MFQRNKEAYDTEQRKLSSKLDDQIRLIFNIENCVLLKEYFSNEGFSVMFHSPQAKEDVTKALAILTKEHASYGVVIPNSNGTESVFINLKGSLKEITNVLARHLTLSPFP